MENCTEVLGVGKDFKGDFAPGSLDLLFRQVLEALAECTESANGFYHFHWFNQQLEVFRNSKRAGKDLQGSEPFIMLGLKSFQKEMLVSNTD